MEKPIKLENFPMSFPQAKYLMALLTSDNLSDQEVIQIWNELGEEGFNMIKVGRAIESLKNVVYS